MSVRLSRPNTTQMQAVDNWLNTTKLLRAYAKYSRKSDANENFTCTEYKTITTIT